MKKDLLKKLAPIEAEILFAAFEQKDCSGKRETDDDDSNLNAHAPKKLPFRNSKFPFRKGIPIN